MLKASVTSWPTGYQEAYKFLRSRDQDLLTSGAGELSGDVLHSVLYVLRSNEVIYVAGNVIDRSSS
jgi:hypothetical protein